MKKTLLFLILMLFAIPLVSSDESQISLSRNSVQMGDSFVLSADNLMIGDTLFNGNAMINFVGPEEYTLLTNVVNGEISYELSFCKNGCLLKNTPGNYSLSITLLDSKLVELQEILLDDTLEVDGALNIIASINRLQINPGQSIKIEGSVQKSSDSSMISEGLVKIIYEEVEYEAILSNKKFVYEFPTDKDISSNYHNIDLFVSDDLGNYGETTLQFFVVPVPQLLSINFDAEEVLPGNSLQINVGLIDQAEEEVKEEIEVRIYDSKNKRVLKEMFLSNEEFGFDLDQFANPGEWKIIVRGAGLKDERTFNVLEVEEISVSLVGQYLELTNVGNVYYSKPLKISVENKTIVERRTNLNPGENITLLLYKDLSEGSHRIYIENVDKYFNVEIVDNRDFGDKFGDFFSSITGQAVKKPGSGTSNIPFLILIVLVVGMLVFVLFSLKGKFRFSSFDRFKSKKNKSQKADIDDIRERILRDIELTKGTKKDENSFSVKPIFGSEDKSARPNRVKFDEPISKRENQGNKKINSQSADNLFKLFD